jgi:hypothetical protein
MCHGAICRRRDHSSRPVGEGCSRCAHAPNRVSRRSQSRAVSACRCAARQSRYRLLSRRRVEFGSRRGVLDLAAAPATRRRVLLKIDQSHAGTARQGSTLSCPPRTPPR